MSVLSSTQGTPERVWSLVAAIAVHGGTLERSQAADLLNPKFAQDGIEVRDDGFSQTLGAATSLGSVEAEKAVLRLAPSCEADDYLTFADWVHTHLVSLDSQEKDAVLLETYAWVVVQSQRIGTVDWIHEWTNDAFADAADQSLPEGSDDDGARRINTTKLPSWRRWLAYMGLFIQMPTGRPHPAAETRIARELKHLDISRGSEIPIDDFLKALTSRLPYLDGGRMFLEAAKRIGHAPAPRRLSPLFSVSLRNLHDEGVIELLLPGDAGNVMQLSPDSSHKLQAAHAVIVNRGSNT